MEEAEPVEPVEEGIFKQLFVSEFPADVRWPDTKGRIVIEGAFLSFPHVSHDSSENGKRARAQKRKKNAKRKVNNNSAKKYLPLFPPSPSSLLQIHFQGGCSLIFPCFEIGTLLKKFAAGGWSCFMALRRIIRLISARFNPAVGRDWHAVPLIKSEFGAKRFIKLTIRKKNFVENCSDSRGIASVGAGRNAPLNSVNFKSPDAGEFQSMALANN